MSALSALGLRRLRAALASKFSLIFAGRKSKREFRVLRDAARLRLDCQPARLDRAREHVPWTPFAA